MRTILIMTAACLCLLEAAGQTGVYKSEVSRSGNLWVVTVRDPVGRPLSVSSYSDSSLKKPQGVFRRYHPDGRPMSEGFWDNGRPEGPFRNWHPDGLLQDTAFYSNGRRTGVYKRLYPNGSLQLSGSFFEDLPVGLWKGYHTDGRIASEAEYERGQVIWVRYHTIDGEVLQDVPNVLIRRTPKILFFDDFLEPEPELRYASYFGRVEPQASGLYRVTMHDFTGLRTAVVHYSSAGFRNKSGPYRRFDDNGRLRVAAEFRSNLLHGEFRRYHATGGLSDSGSLRNGDRYGVWKSWYATGGRRDSGEYRQGLRTGIWNEWEEGTGVRAVGFYQRGARRGDWKHYDRSGRILFVNRYRWSAIGVPERVGIGID
jgi:antitoxin component YwqK of YwqJK toxin-antitoxin module